jgi:hypothetical protein
VTAAPDRRDAQAGEQVVSGVRWEPAEVWLNDGRPVRFGWRGRFYTVLAVLERPPAQEPSGESPARGPDPESDGQHDAPGGHGRQPEWRCWLVSAAPGKNVPPHAYRLCQNANSARWVLSRDVG